MGIWNHYWRVFLVNDRPYDHLIFDWDGTLMDSSAWIIHCMQRAIDDEGMPFRDEETIREYIRLQEQKDQRVDQLSLFK